MSAAWKYMGKPQLDVAWSIKEWNLSKMKFLSKASWFSFLIQIRFFFWAKPQEDILILSTLQNHVLYWHGGKKCEVLCRGFPFCQQGGKTNVTADVLYVACKRIQVATHLVHWAGLSTGVAVSSNWVHMTDITSGASVHMSTQHTSGITVRCCSLYFCPIVLNALLSNFRLKGAITITCIIIIIINYIIILCWPMLLPPRSEQQDSLARVSCWCLKVRRFWVGTAMAVISL